MLDCHTRCKLGPVTCLLNTCFSRHQECQYADQHIPCSDNIEYFLGFGIQELIVIGLMVKEHPILIEADDDLFKIQLVFKLLGCL